MTDSATLDKLIALDAQVLRDSDAPSSESAWNTRARILELALRQDWTAKDTTSMSLLAHKFDVSGHLRARYPDDGTKTANEVLDRGWLALFTGLLAKNALLFLATDTAGGGVAKAFNVYFKAMDKVRPDWLAPGSNMAQVLAKEWTDHVGKLPGAGSPAPTDLPPATAASISHEIPLDVLFYEGPIARAYLETMRSLAVRPRKIIQLTAARDLANGRRVGLFLPSAMRAAYAATLHKKRIHHWPQTLLKAHEAACRELFNGLAHTYKIAPSAITAAQALPPLDSYSDHVETLLIDGLKDPRLSQHLGTLPPSCLLFTGGGIVPAEILDIEHLKFLHIHPGYLPDIRGADCLLWSSLLTGRPSASCFYMKPGIDMGDIVDACWLPPVYLPASLRDLEAKQLYRFVYSFVDPWVRSAVLQKVLLEHEMFGDLPTTPQKIADGTTYTFMHETIQARAFDILFGANSAS